jgi:hypothetical protein
MRLVQVVHAASFSADIDKWLITCSLEAVASGFSLRFPGDQGSRYNEQ